MKNSFVFRKVWSDAISELPDNIRLEIYEAIIEYGTSGNISKELKQVANALFKIAKATLDEDAEREKEISEKRRKAGNIGNAKRWNKNNESVANAITESQNSQMRPNAIFAIPEIEKENEKDVPMVSSPTPLSSLPLEKEKEKDRANRASAYDVNEIYLDKFFETKQELIEKLLMDFGMKPDEKKKLREIAESIVNEWRITEEFHASEEVWRKHLVNTLRIKVKLGTPSAPTKHAELNDLARQVREEREQKTQELIRKHDEWASKSVSLEEARNSEEYKRAMAEA